MMKVKLGHIIQAIFSVLILQCYSILACQPSFSRQYCQILNQANTSEGKLLQCSKNDNSCLVQAYEDRFSKRSYNSLINEIMSLQNAAVADLGGGIIQQQQSFSQLQTLSVIFQEIRALIFQVWRDIAESVLFEKEAVSVIQYSQNFASLDGGAMILKISSDKIKQAHAILEQNNDRYLYTDEQLPIQIVIALKEEVSIETIVIKSSEIYSSTMRQFIIYGAFALDGSDHGEDNWSKLLQATATNSALKQQYRIMKKVVRFLKIRIISAHGDWKYFTMTQIKVYGSSLYAEAMTSYKQNTNQIQVQTEVDMSSIHLYEDLKKMATLTKQGNRIIPQNNLITYFFQELQKLSKLEEQQILYMHNMTLKLQRLENKTIEATDKGRSDNSTKQVKENQYNQQRSKQYNMLNQGDRIQSWPYLSQQCQLSNNQRQLNDSGRREGKDVKGQRNGSITKMFQPHKIIKKNIIRQLNSKIKELALRIPELSQGMFLLITIITCTLFMTAIGVIFWLKMKQQFRVKYVFSALNQKQPTSKDEKHILRKYSKECIF